MQFSRIFVLASLLLAISPHAVSATVDRSENLLKSPKTLFLAQNIASEEEPIWKNAALGSLAIALVEVGDRDRLAEIVSKIEDPDVREQILSELGLRLAKKGEIELAWDFLEQERDLSFLAEIFRNLIFEKQTDRAWELVKLSNGEDNHILLLFVNAAIANQKYDRAWEILRDLEPDLLESISLRGLAFGFAEQGKSDRLREIIAVVDSDRDRQDLLLLMALSLAENGKPKRALDIVPRLERTIDKIHALGVIGFKFREIGDRDRGEKQFDRLRRLLSELELNAQTNAVFNNLSTYLARGGEFDRALELSAHISDSSTRTEALFYIARYLGEAGELARALELVPEIEFSGLRETILEQVAVNLAKNGKSDRALALIRSFADSDETLKNIATVLAENEQFDRALEIVTDIRRTELRIVTLGAIAFHLHQNKRLETARETLAQALELWETLEQATLKDSLLGLIVLPFVEIEAYDLALELLQNAVNLDEKSNSLRDATYTVAETGNREESLKFINLMENEIEKIGAFIFLAVQLDRQEQKKDAIATLTKALKLTETLSNPEQKALLLSSIATQFAELGQAQQAMEIIDRVVELLQVQAL
ncbi:MAG: tetratricopeptide repeat protein [Spirulina sp.]